jgi:hypothetical protein
MTTRFSPLSRSPDLVFKTLRFRPSPLTETTTYKENSASLLGIAEAVGSLEGWTDTPMFFKVYRVQNGDRQHLVLGSRCGPLHMPHLTARTNSPNAEDLWCTNCWSDSLINIPFYMYYRHYDDHILGKLPACPVCEKRFQIWEPDEPLAPGNAYLLSALRNADFESAVEILLSTNKE